MPKNPEPITLPPQRGRIIFEGKEAVNFWIRAFRLEDDIHEVHEQLLAEKPGTVANISISSEYRVSPELIFIYLIAPVLDMLGVCDGAGVVYFVSPQFEKEAASRRDEFTEDTIRTAREMGKLREVRATQPHKEP